MKNVKLTLNPRDRKSKINKEIYSNFSEHLGRCIYDGIYVGENSDIPNIEGYRKDVVEAFRQLKLPVLRWPGGCFADEYHWKDGIGDKPQRKGVVNNWGHVSEDNSFGTHEFLRFCELVGCQPYISANVGSGTVRELMEWIEYITFDGTSPMTELRRKNGRQNAWKLKYLGIGNESWGCGGNMTPEYYCDNYKRYATFCREYSGNSFYKIACGPNADDYNWTEVCMKKIGPWQMNGLSMHYYTVPTGNWDHKGSSTEFDSSEYYSTLRSTWRMEELVTRHSAIMDRYDPQHRVGLVVDEWGCWYDVEPGTDPSFLYQLNTMRDAIVAAINLNIFNSHSDRVYMANIAQAVNVLQSVLLTEGAATVKTPTFHVFDMFKEHMENTLIYSHIENEQAADGVLTFSQSASVNDRGEIVVTLANCSLENEYTVNITGAENAAKASGCILTGEVHAKNDFDSPDNVHTTPLEVKCANGEVSALVPPCSGVRIIIG